MTPLDTLLAIVNRFCGTSERFSHILVELGSGLQAKNVLGSSTYCLSVFRNLSSKENEKSPTVESVQ